jgi:SAM-dependent methyltransferase
VLPPPPTVPPPPSDGRRLLILAFLTGLCGLGSETLYFKLLDYAVGAAPLVAFTVVASFLLGVGTGAYLSSRIRRPWLVEGALALYNLAWLLAFEPLLRGNGWLLARLVPLLGPNLGGALLGIVYVAPPALLLGVTFPGLVERRAHVAIPYLVQAAGAVVGVAVFEAVLFPLVGMPGCLAALALAHAATAALLLGRRFRFEPLRFQGLRPVLVVVGSATGTLQGAWLFIAGLLFQPLYFVQPTVVATALVGILVGSLLWLRWRLDFEQVVRVLLGGVALSLGLILLVTRLPGHPSLATALVELPLLVLPVTIPAGALVPAFLRDRAATRGETGAALLSVSLGNALGLLLAPTLVRFGPPHLPLLVASALLVVALGQQRSLFAGPRRRLLLAATPIVVMLALLPWLGPSGYVQRSLLLKGQSVEKIEFLVRGPAELSGVFRVATLPESQGGPKSWMSPFPRRLYQSGYSPIALETGAEALIAVAAAGYAPDNARALVIGGGSGQTAGTVALAFRHVDVVDIGATVPALMRRLSEENFGLLDRPTVRLHQLDGVIAPYALRGGYDLVLNTVDPGFLAKAAKLYTVEAMRGFKRLLRPGGVFVFWADTDYGAEGNQVLINTGRQVFAHQRLVPASTPPPGRGGQAERDRLSYYFLVHSDAPLDYRPLRFGLREALGRAKIRDLEPHFNQGSRAPLVRGRAHPTAQIHTLARPAWCVLFGRPGTMILPLTPE